MTHSYIVVKLRAGSEHEDCYRVQSFELLTDGEPTYDDVLNWLHRVNENDRLGAGDIEAMWDCDSEYDMDLWADALRYTLGEFSAEVTRERLLEVETFMFNCGCQDFMPQYPMEYIDYLEHIKEAL